MVPHPVRLPSRCVWGTAVLAVAVAVATTAAAGGVPPAWGSGTGKDSHSTSRRGAGKAGSATPSRPTKKKAVEASSPARRPGSKGPAGGNAGSRSGASGKSRLGAPKVTGKVKRAGKLNRRPSRVAAAKPPPPPPPRGRVALFAFRGDETNSASVQAHVARALRAKGLKVVTGLRPVDSAEQYREMAVALDLAVYVDGEVSDEGDDLASATVHVRSGVTGLRVASATFSGQRRQLPSEVKATLWTEVGPAFSRVCADAAKPRRHAREPMRIEAGTPIESTPAEPTPPPVPPATPGAARGT